MVLGKNLWRHLGEWYAESEIHGNRKKKNRSRIDPFKWYCKLYRKKDIKLYNVISFHDPLFRLWFTVSYYISLQFKIIDQIQVYWPRICLESNFKIFNEGDQMQITSAIKFVIIFQLFEATFQTERHMKYAFAHLILYSIAWFA